MRLLAAILICTMVSGCTAPPVSKATHWNPDSAIADAEHDIAQRTVRFAYVGGFVPFAPGIAAGQYATLKRYGRLEVGSQGCCQDEHSPERHEYARRYNEKMWDYVSTRH